MLDAVGHRVSHEVRQRTTKNPAQAEGYECLASDQRQLDAFLLALAHSGTASSSCCVLSPNGRAASRAIARGSAESFGLSLLASEQASSSSDFCTVIVSSTAAPMGDTWMRCFSASASRATARTTDVPTVARNAS
jgi:hypothetical protein